MSTTKKHDPAAVKAVIEALERLAAEPTGVNMIRYSDLALPFNVGLHVTGFSVAPVRDGATTTATVDGADKALSYLRSLL